MSFLNDNSGNSITEKKKLQRLEYLESCLKAFISIYPKEICYSKQIAVYLNDAYWKLIFPVIRSKMINPNNRVDHHKIISGTQAAIMMCCLLRTEETADIPIITGRSKENKDVLDLNSAFALFAAINILEQWNDIDVSPLQERNNFLREHKAWLQNAIVPNKANEFSFPFFAVSQIWYVAEELCKTSSKNSLPE